MILESIDQLNYTHDDKNFVYQFWKQIKIYEIMPIKDTDMYLLIENWGYLLHFVRAKRFVDYAPNNLHGIILRLYDSFKLVQLNESMKLTSSCCIL